MKQGIANVDSKVLGHNLSGNWTFIHLYQVTHHADLVWRIMGL